MGLQDPHLSPLVPQDLLHQLGLQYQLLTHLLDQFYLEHLLGQKHLVILLDQYHLEHLLGQQDRHLVPLGLQDLLGLNDLLGQHTPFYLLVLSDLQGHHLGL